MKEFISATLIAILITGLFVFLFWKFEIVITTKSRIRTGCYGIAEYAYYEGQKDYAENDIRIAKCGDYYVWTKSPWDCGRKVTYNPFNDNIPASQKNNKETGKLNITRKGSVKE